MGFDFKSKPFPTVRGGSTKMAGKQTVGTRKSGMTGPGSKPVGKFLKGGMAKMAGKGSSKSAKAC